ncbi:MAG: branched-chain amino acid ABC transporter permease [Anaerolineae bacterium]|nr:branched-chain amino acid ABC transporter permease [Anaerolineae bacterium]
MTALLKDNRRYLTITLYVVAVVVLLALFAPVVGAQRPARLVQSGITGLLVGGIYALIALGIVIINKASGVFNFAHGWMMLLGGFLFYSFFTVVQISPVASAALALLTVLMALTVIGWSSLRDLRVLGAGALAAIIITMLLLVEIPLLRGIVGAVCGSVLIGLAAERFAIRPLIGQPLFAMVLMTLALSEVLHGIEQMIWGSVEIPLSLFAGIKDLGLPVPIRFEMFDSSVIVRTELLIAFALSLLAFVAFVAFFQFTSVGLAMRATAENQKLAQSVGLRVRVILGVAWAIAALLATVAGVLQGGATSLSLNMPLLALRAFPAVLLGGLESVPGALIGGLIIGLVQEYANLLFPGTQAGTELAPYLVLMVVLVIRPDGLFGQKRIERI